MAKSGKRPASASKASSASRPTVKKQEPKPAGWTARLSSGPAMAWGSQSERVAYYLLHALVFLVPIAISNFVWLGISQFPFSFDQFDLAKVVVQRVLTFAALGALAWSMFTHGGKFKKSNFYWLILAFLAWVFVSSLFSIHVPTAFFGKYRRLEGFFSFVNYAVIFFLGLQLIDRPSKMRSIIRTLFFSNVIVVGYGILQWRGLDPIQWGQLPFEATRAFSTYGNPDLLGGFLMFSLPTALGLALSEENTIWRVVYWVGFLATVVVWIVSFVRGAWIGGALALVILIAAAFWLREKMHTTDWVFVGITALAGVGLTVYSSVTGKGVLNFAERFASIAAVNEGSSKTRYEIWQAAVGAIKDRPIFGFGADTFRLVFPKYKPFAYSNDAGYLSVADNVHNYALQLTAGIGIPGSLMFFSLVGWELIASARYAWDREAGAKRVLYTSIWAAVIGYIVLLMTNLSVTGNTIFLWLFLGLLAVPLSKTVEFKAPAWGQAAAVAAVVLAIAGAGYWMWWASADYYYLIGRIGPISTDQRIAAIQEAIRRNPFNDMYLAELPLRYQDQFVALMQQAQQEQQAGQNAQATLQAAKAQLALAEQGFHDVIAFVPPEYDNYVFLANLYNQAGTFLGDPRYFQQAIAVGKQGIAIEPNGPAIRLQTAIAYSSLGQYKEAIPLLTHSISLDPNFADPWSLLGEVYLRSGQYAKAVAVYKVAVARFPTDSRLKTGLANAEASATAGQKKK